MEAGIVEEVAKLLTVVVIMRNVRYKYILNGILFGATVGAGFAAFETAGYALNEGFLQGLLPAVLQGGALTQQVMGPAIPQQGVSQMLSILFHCAASWPRSATWRGRRSPLERSGASRPTSRSVWGCCSDKRFLMAFAIPVALHAYLGRADPVALLEGNQILTGLVTWYVVFRAGAAGTQTGQG